MLSPFGCYDFSLGIPLEITFTVTTEYCQNTESLTEGAKCLLHTIVCQITHSTRDVLFWVWQYPPYPSYNGNFILFWDTKKNIPRHLMTEGEIIFFKHTLSMKKYKRRLFLFFDFPVCFFFIKKIGRYIYFHKSPIVLPYFRARLCRERKEYPYMFATAPNLLCTGVKQRQ